jgi:uncharacterized membrane protein SirB2
MAASYAVLKAIHVGAVTLSGAGFFARGLGMLAGARWVHGRLARVAPHLVDTTLLVSAVALAWTLRVSPLTDAWLAAKLIGLLAYVGLGLIALRFGRTRTVRATAWAGALLAFAYIVSVALTKDPRGWLAG